MFLRFILINAFFIINFKYCHRAIVSEGLCTVVQRLAGGILSLSITLFVFAFIVSEYNIGDYAEIGNSCCKLWVLIMCNQ